MTMTALKDFSMERVQDCVQVAVPHIFAHIMDKIGKNTNNGEGCAIHPLTKLLTLGLDKATRHALEHEIMKQGIKQEEINFIRACSMTIGQKEIDEVINDIDDHEGSSLLWPFFDEQCHRDGSIFMLEFYQGQMGSCQEAAGKLIERFSM